MLNLELGELYGLSSLEELLSTINELQELGFSDERINEILNRSRTKNKEVTNGTKDNSDRG